MHPIQKQAQGLPLHPAHDTKVEYQLRAGKGRVVMSFDCPERAAEERNKRGLHLFRVTTFTEKL